MTGMNMLPICYLNSYITQSNSSIPVRDEMRIAKTALLAT